MLGLVDGGVDWFCHDMGVVDVVAAWSHREVLPSIIWILDIVVI